MYNSYEIIGLLVCTCMYIKKGLRLQVDAFLSHEISIYNHIKKAQFI